MTEKQWNKFANEVRTANRYLKSIAELLDKIAPPDVEPIEEDPDVTEDDLPFQ